MESTKLYQTLSAFDAYELNRLKKFVDSPYFNSNDKISHLFDIFYEHFKNNKDVELEKHHLYKQVTGYDNYEDRKFRKLMSDLLKLVESFLVVEEYENHPLQQTNHLIRAVHDRKLEKLYNTTVKKARRLANRQPERSANYFLQQYHIEKNYYELTESEINRTKRSNIDSIIQNLDYFYLAEKLKYYCTLLSRRKIHKHDYDILFIEEILKHIESHDYSEHPQIIVYFHVYKVYKSYKNTSNFYALKKLIVKHDDIFSIDDLRDFYLAAINFSIANLNKGKPEFLNELLETYKEALAAKALFIDGMLSPWSFKNIVITGLRVGEFDWTETFIDEYSEYLNEKYRENALTFNKARLYYYRKEYGKVIPLLNQVEFTDFSYNLDSKALLLATYYELDEIDALHSFLDTFRTFLNRQKQSLPEARRKNYLNLITYTKRLSNIFPGDSEALDSLQKDIENNPQIADINWLKEKIRELQGKAVH